MGHRIIEIVDLPIKNGWISPVRYVIYVSLPEGSSTPERIIWRITPRLLLENPVEIIGDDRPRGPNPVHPVRQVSFDQHLSNVMDWIAYCQVCFHYQ